MSRRKKTTRKEFEAFCDAFCRWQNTFGLGEYTVDFELEDHSEYSTISVDATDCVASATFCKYVPADCGMSLKEAEETGKHEAIHLLFARFSDLAGNRFTSKDELYHEEERIVRILEKLL